MSKDKSLFQNLLEMESLGVKISYKIRDKPNGIAEVNSQL